MKLALMVIYQFTKSIKSIVLWVLTLLFIGTLPVDSQQYKLSLRKTNLADAMEQTSKLLNIRVAFDAQKLSQIAIDKEISGNTPDEVLKKLLANSGYSFEFRHDNFLIYKSEEKSDENVCQIIGSITDIETGEQLPYATIKIKDQNIYVSSSENGTFYLKQSNAKSIQLNISYIGYYPLDTLVYCNAPKVVCKLALKKNIQELEKVEVREPKIEMVDYRNDVDFATTINASKLLDLPMFAETDIFRALQLLPGVSFSESSSELNIRGGSSDQNLVLLDGQTLYNQSHYFGVFSALNPNVVKDVQVFKGGYDSRYGERVSGIVDITGKNGNKLKPTVYGDVNLINGNIAAEVPVSKKLTVIMAGRRTYGDIYSTEFANNLFEKDSNRFSNPSQRSLSYSKPKFSFYDYNTKVSYQLNDGENVSFSVYGAKDSYDNKYNTGDKNFLASIHENNKWGNYGLNASWLKQWNGALFTNVQIGSSGYSDTYNSSSSLSGTGGPHYPSGPPFQNKNYDSYSYNELNDYSASVKGIWNQNGKHQFSFGATVRQNKIYYHKDADRVYIYENMNQAAVISSLFLQDRLIITDRLTIKPGLRISFYDGNNGWYSEPRFAANYRLTDAWSVRFATGRFYQYINQVQVLQETGYNKNFWVLTDDSIHPVVKSNHYIFGTSIDLGSFFFDVEPYYKTYSGLQEYIFVSNYTRDSTFRNLFDTANMQMFAPKERPGLFIHGQGKSYGIDFHVRYKYNNFTTWLSYSLSKSTRQFSEINNGNEVPASTDQRHQITWTNMYAFKNWNFGLTNYYSTGRPYVDLSIDARRMPTIRSYKRLPDYYRTDISANYNFKIGEARIKAGATIINLFNVDNYYDVNSRKFDTENASFSETNVVRAQDRSLNLFIHFVF
mgnify:CR=1 FL=1